MQKLKFINGNGVEIDLTDKVNFGITAWEGFSADGLNIQSQQVPFQDGGVFLDALMDQRELSVTVAINAKGDLDKRYRLRRELISVLNPKLGEGVLIYSDNYLSKQIHVIPQIPLFDTNNSNDSGTPKVSCSFTACDPYWEDLEETNFILNVGETINIVNNGDVKTPIKIEIKGNVLNSSIIKLNTKQRIQIKTLINEPLIIDTNNGNKTVYKMGLDFTTGVIYSDWDYVATNGDIIIAISKWFGIILNAYNERKYLPVFYNGMKSVTYGNGKFVICNNNKYIVSEDNGENWTETSLPAGIDNTSYNIILFEHNLFFVFAKSGNYFKIYKSSDLQTFDLIYTEDWNLQTLNKVKIAYGNNMYLITCNNDTNNAGKGELLKYEITIGMQKTIDQSNYRFYDIAYGNGKFIITTGDSHKQIETTDGENIIVSDINTSDSVIIFYKDKFVKYSSSYQLSSSIDGSIWKQETSLNNPIDAMIEYNKSLYIFYQNYISSTTNLNQFYTIIDINANQMGINNNGETTNVLFINNKYYCAGRTQLLYSEDGISFIAKNLVPRLTIFSIARGNGKIVMISSSTIAVFNEENLENDVINYTIITESLQNIKGIKFLNGKFIVYGINTILTSENGVNWTTTNPPQKTYTSVAYCNGYYIFTSYNSNIIRTIDFVNFENINDITLSQVCSNENLFLGISTKIINSVTYYVFKKSIDGLNWEESEITIQYKGDCYMIYENGYFMGILGNKVVYSIDAQTFYTLNNPIDLKCEGIGFGDNKFIFLQNRVVSCTENSKEVNMISYLSADSDMNLGLDIGDNIIKFISEEGSATAEIKFRQKYIGV